VEEEKIDPIAAGHARIVIIGEIRRDFDDDIHLSEKDIEAFAFAGGFARKETRED